MIAGHRVEYFEAIRESFRLRSPFNTHPFHPALKSTTTDKKEAHGLLFEKRDTLVLFLAGEIFP